MKAALNAHSVQIRIPEEAWQRLRHVATERGTTASSILSQAGEVVSRIPAERLYNAFAELEKFARR